MTYSDPILHSATLFQLTSLTWMKAAISESTCFCHTAPQKIFSMLQILPRLPIAHKLHNTLLSVLSSTQHSSSNTLRILEHRMYLCLCTYFFFLEQSPLFSFRTAIDPPQK